MPYGILEQLKDVNILSVIVRFLLITICSGILGYDRERGNQAAGFRTYIIVSNAAALVMLTNIYISQNIGSTDLARMPASVITGLGFLGAGTILVTRNHEVRGLTTAAGLWSVAIIGIAIGAGFYIGGLVCFVVIFFAMEILKTAEKEMDKSSKETTVYCEVTEQRAVGSLIQHFKSNDCSIDNLEIHGPLRSTDDVRSLLYELKPARGTKLDRVIADAEKIEGVLCIHIL